jgi:hypothetical protein
MKIIDLYKNGKEEIKRIENLKTSKKLSFKTALFTTLFTIIMAIPFIIISSSLITIYSPIRVMFWVTMFFICIGLPLIMSISAVFNIYLLNNYLEEAEELQKINYKAIFIKELLNPVSWILGIFICAFICYVAIYL